MVDKWEGFCSCGIKRLAAQVSDAVLVGALYEIDKNLANVIRVTLRGGQDLVLPYQQIQNELSTLHRKRTGRCDTGSS